MMNSNIQVWILNLKISAYSKESKEVYKTELKKLRILGEFFFGVSNRGGTKPREKKKIVALVFFFYTPVKIVIFNISAQNKLPET